MEIWFGKWFWIKVLEWINKLGRLCYLKIWKTTMGAFMAGVPP